MKLDSIASAGLHNSSINTQWEGAAQTRVSGENSSPVERTNTEQQRGEERNSIISDNMLDNAIGQANKALQVHKKFIERSIHEKTKTIMYVLKDMETNEVIREFPPRKIQDMIAKMWELAGLMVDERR